MPSRRGQKPFKTNSECVEEVVCQTVTLAKWAIITALKKPPLLFEATITYGDVLGGMGGFISGYRHFRRQEENNGPLFEPTAEEMARASDLFVKTRALLSRSTYLEQALWYWGRSSLASLERDGLLEAMIGLDGLLASGSRYKLGLYGASLLAHSPDEAEKIAEDLRDLYDKRSSAAHGGMRHAGADGSRALTSRAATFLGDAIRAITDLTERGILDPEKSIAKQIENLILQRCPLIP